MEVGGWIAGGIVCDYDVEEGRVIGKMFDIAEAIEAVDVLVLEFLHIELVFFGDVAFMDYEGVETLANIG